MTDKDDVYWREKLTPEEYHVLRQKGTERAFTGEYWDTTEVGTYTCRGCGETLFESDSKFDAGCGWPSFDKPATAGVIDEERDTSHGMIRTEVLCQNCGGIWATYSPTARPKLVFAIASTACQSISKKRAELGHQLLDRHNTLAITVVRNSGNMRGSDFATATNDLGAEVNPGLHKR